ncbi:hypothetical protein RF11_08362 [Thelohanellus kitauei]|uniref:Uncharacterized protein n=1 Tax=Thelohanellus kitauei TaxID=669202 RepID=A0A0C2M8J9_THEKT|nr:hypothetical protein RF11_08362 [Thelohanellus kitauei]
MKQTPHSIPASRTWLGQSVSPKLVTCQGKNRSLWTVESLFRLFENGMSEHKGAFLSAGLGVEKVKLPNRSKSNPSGYVLADQRLRLMLSADTNYLIYVNVQAASIPSL